MMLSGGNVLVYLTRINRSI